MPPRLIALLCVPQRWAPRRYRDPTASIAERADDLLARMTTDEKIAMWAPYGSFDGAAAIGARFNGTGVGQPVPRGGRATRRRWRPRATRCTRDPRRLAARIPASLEEALHSAGHRRDPLPRVGHARSSRTPRSSRTCRPRSRARRALGVDVAFAPVINLWADARFGRLQEGYLRTPRSPPRTPRPRAAFRAAVGPAPTPTAAGSTAGQASSRRQGARARFRPRERERGHVAEARPENRPPPPPPPPHFPRSFSSPRSTTRDGARRRAQRRARRAHEPHAQRGTWRRGARSRARAAARDGRAQHGRRRAVPQQRAPSTARCAARRLRRRDRVSDCNDVRARSRARRRAAPETKPSPPSSPLPPPLPVPALVDLRVAANPRTRRQGAPARVSTSTCSAATGARSRRQREPEPRRRRAALDRAARRVLMGARRRLFDRLFVDAAAANAALTAARAAAPLRAAGARARATTAPRSRSSRPRRLARGDRPDRGLLGRAHARRGVHAGAALLGSYQSNDAHGAEYARRSPPCTPTPLFADSQESENLPRYEELRDALAPRGVAVRSRAARRRRAATTARSSRPRPLAPRATSRRSCSRRPHAARGDRDSLELLGAQLPLLEAVAATGTPTVVVHVGGRTASFGAPANGVLANVSALGPPAFRPHARRARAQRADGRDQPERAARAELGAVRGPGRQRRVAVAPVARRQVWVANAAATTPTDGRRYDPHVDGPSSPLFYLATA